MNSKIIWTVHRQIDGITRSAIAAYTVKEAANKAADRLRAALPEYEWVVDFIQLYDGQLDD